MNSFKEAGKMVVTLSIIATAIYILVEHPKYWAAVIVLACILAMWLQLVYHLFKRVNVSNKGLTFDGNTERTEEEANPEELKNKVDKLNRRLSKTEAKNRNLQDQINSLNKRVIDISKSTAEGPELTVHEFTAAELFRIFYFTNGLEEFDKTQTPIDVDSFHNTVEEAKKSDKPFDENHYYKLIVDKYSEAFTYALIKKITFMCDMSLLAKEEQTLYKAVKRPYSKATILAVRDELTKDDNKAKLTLEFERFIKELDMLY